MTWPYYCTLMQMRLRDTFDQFDVDRSGRLSVSELGELVRTLMPDMSEPELAYFQVGSLFSRVGWCLHQLNM